MLKYVFAFFAFILVSLAPVYADEGYIPYFPDFLEPDGIGFRGPSSITGELCWSSKGGCDTHQHHQPGMPFSRGQSSVRSSPITLEYRKNYLFKKLIYYQALTDFGSVVSNAVLSKNSEDPGGDNPYTYQVLLEDPIMKNFITAEEKSILSSLDSSRILDIKTESNFILFGASIGLDLWFIEISNGIFLMHHQTKASLRSCKPVNWAGSSGSGFDWSQCRFNPDDIIKVSDQSFSGFAFGTRGQFNLVFLQTDN